MSPVLSGKSYDGLIMTYENSFVSSPESIINLEKNVKYFYLKKLLLYA